MGYASLQTWIVNGFSTIVLLDIIVFVHGLTFYYLSKVKNRFRQLIIPYILMLTGFLVYYWFQSSGYMGSTGVGSVAVGIIAVLISNKKSRPYLMYSMILLISLLVFIQENTSYTSPEDIDYVTIPVTFTILSSAIVMMVGYVKKWFDKERATVYEQNKKLEKLNRELSKILIEKEEMIDEINNTRDKLIESEKMASLGKLTSGIANELDNPLNYIGGVVTPLKRDIQDIYQSLSEVKRAELENTCDEIRILIDQVEQGSKKANEIIKKLKKYSIDETSQSSSFIPLRLFDVISSIHDYYKRKNQNIQFFLDCPEALEVKGNKFELDQAFSNFYQNAIESISNNGPGIIRVTVSRREKSLITTISDDGAGISHENLKKIFDPFFSTKDPTKAGNVRGLGLYTSYSIIRRHDGEIKVESEPEKGTSVNVFLPVFEE